MAAQAGHPCTLNNLAYKFGHSVNVDKKQETQYYQKAATLKQSVATFNITSRQAANQGAPASQNNLGVTLAEGQLLPKDES